MNIAFALFAAFFIYSHDGATADGGLRTKLPQSLIDADKPTRIAAGWFDYVSAAPTAATNEIVKCTGFKRLGDDFTGIYETVALTVSGDKYSVRAVIKELKTSNKWAAVKALLVSADFYEEFLGSNYLSSADADFQTMMAAIVSQGVMTQAELDALLPKCIWTNE